MSFFIFVKLERTRNKKKASLSATEGTKSKEVVELDTNP